MFREQIKMNFKKQCQDMNKENHQEVDYNKMFNKIL
jgi:hypothetical protein